MSFVAGLLKGFNTRSAQARAESRAAQDAQDAKEEKILTYLASADDEEVSTAATTALLDRAAGTKPPKGGFLASLMGPQTQVHPAVASLLKLVKTPTTQEIPGLAMSQISFPGALPPPPQGAPKMQTPPPGAAPTSAAGAGTPLPPPPTAAPPGSAAMAPPPAPGSVGLPQGGPPAVGAGPAGLPPPPTGPVMTAPPPPLFTPAGRLPGTTITQPRKLFLSSTDRVLAGAKAKAQGDVEGEVAGLIAAGFTDVEARGLVKENYERRARTGSTAAPFQAVALEVPDGRGGWTPTQGTFNRSTGQYEDLAGTPLTQARPRQTTGSTSLGTDREALARAYFGKPFALLDQTQQRNVLNLEMNFVQNEAFRRGTGTGQASVNTALDMPIGITAGQDQNTDPTRALGSMGGTAIARPLPQTEADKLAEYQNAVQMAEALGTALTSGSAGVAGTGTAAKLATLAPNFLTEYTGWGIDEKSRNAVIALAKQIIGKSFEGGVLRKEDEIKYKDILPTMGDAPEVAASKVAMLKTRVAAQLATHQQTLGSAGFRVGQPPPAVSGPPPLGGKVFDHTKFKVDARTDAAGHTIYIGTNADGSLVELVFRDGQYFIK